MVPMTDCLRTNRISKIQLFAERMMIICVAMFSMNWKNFQGIYNKHKYLCNSVMSSEVVKNLILIYKF